MSDMQIARKLKNKMKNREPNLKLKGTLKEICIMIDAKRTRNYDKVFKTELYIKHGGEYCEYLELIHEEFKTIQAA